MKDHSAFLDDIVHRIVEAANPRRIILFGSAARGTMGPDSDLDLLIVMPEGVHRRKTSHKIFRALKGIGMSKDVIVVTEKDVAEHRNNPSLVLMSALDEGMELYVAG